MAAVIPALVGSAMGAGVAAAAGIAAGTIGATIASSIGAMVVSSVFNDTNPFDDPAGAIASIAMGAMFSQAVQGLTAGEGVTINGTDAAPVAQGISSASTLTGNIYDTAPSAMVSSGLETVGELGFDSYANTITELGSSEGWDILGLDQSMHDMALVQAINKTNYNYGDFATQVGGDLDFLPAKSDFALPESPTYFDMLESGSEQGLMLQEQTSDFGDVGSNLTQDASLEGTSQVMGIRRMEYESPMERAEKKQNKLKNPFGSAASQSPSFKMPQMPQSIQTLMGSQSAGSGTGGQGGYNSTQNRVVGPMIESYKRQQERMSNIANQTWGIQQTSRFSGLLS